MDVCVMQLTQQILVFHYLLLQIFTIFLYFFATPEDEFGSSLILHCLCCASSLSSDVSFVVDVMDTGVLVYQLCAILSQPASAP